jgi:hypothetical protein
LRRHYKGLGFLLHLQGGAAAGNGKQVKAIDILKNLYILVYGRRIEMKNHQADMKGTAGRNKALAQSQGNRGRRRMFFVLQLAAFVGCSSAQEISAFNYIALKGYHTANSITFSNIEDFANVIKENKIHTVFYTSGAFLVLVQSVIYLMPSNQYKSIEDYKDGNATGFKDGGSYYYAKEVGFTSQEEVDYYKSQNFLSVSDYRDAKKLGFVNNTADAIQTLTGILSETDLRKSLPYIAMFLGNKDIGDIEDAVRNSNGRIQRLPFGGNYWIDNLPVSGNNYGDQFPEEIKDSTFYYACKAAQYESLSDYLDRNPDDSFTIKGTDKLYVSFGFKSFEDAIIAGLEGFKDSGDFYLAKKYNLSSTELIADRTFVDKVEKIKKDYSIDATDAAVAIVYVLDQPKDYFPKSVRNFVDDFISQYKDISFVRKTGALNLNAPQFIQLYNECPPLQKLVKLQNDILVNAR